MSRPLTPSIADCIEHRWLRPVFQPIGSLVTGDVFGFEALIRGPVGTPLESPVALFAEAARAGRHVELERVAARISIQAFMEADLPGKLFLNYSADSLRDIEDTRDDVRTFLQTQGLASDRIVLELTEQAPLGALESLAKAVFSIRSRGAQFALDDYGTGHASLGQWIALKPDYVKIARVIIDGVATSPFQREALQALCKLAQTSGTRLIAEGIEHEDDLVVCRDLGIDFAQGYLLARPSPEPPLTLSDTALRALHRGRLRLAK